ncbi:MAG: ROK family transcriptional regulator [Thermotogaceae bacterium]|nr:ROK family transcriptional regulator [Thermotogaceae bacterium]
MNDERHVTNIKNKNRYRILKYIYDHGKASKAELSRKLQLSPPTISRNVRPFMGNLLVERGKLPSKVGRYPDLIEFDYSHKKILAFQVDRDFMNVGFGNLSGSIESFQKIEKSMYEFEDFLQSLKDVLKNFENLKEEIAAVVLGISGYVLANGRFHVSICNWNGHTTKEIVKIIKENFEQAIVAFDNDANLFAFRELHLSRKNKKYILCLYWGRGLGMGIVMDGKIYTGKGMAGEIGLTMQGEKKLEEILYGLIGTDQLVENVARILLNLQRIFDPEAIVLTGRFSEFFDKLERIWNKKYSKPCNLTLSEGGEMAIIEGGVAFGAELYIRKLTTGIKNLERVWG